MTWQEKMLRRLLKRLRFHRRAVLAGLRVIADRPPAAWSRWDNRQLIRLNRLCEGLPAFRWDGKPRRVAGVFECQVSLHSFGNITQEPDLAASVRDLVAFNTL